MSFRNRIILAIAALLMIPVFFTPLWSVTLYAPQYPDGIGFYIMVNDLEGHERHDLQNINILNHYVGMQEIHAEDFPELEIMPWVMGGVILFGLIAALTGKPWLLISWVGLAVVVVAAGLIRFYMWGYEFGHDLNPQAPIKIPGETYQPPLLGSKQLANITAYSWPCWGGLFYGIAILAGLFLIWSQYRSGGSSDKQPTNEDDQPSNEDTQENHPHDDRAAVGGGPDAHRMR